MARSESTAELLCAELSADGLPMDRAVAEGIVARVVGPRPRTDIEVADQRAERDAEVLRHAPAADHVDLRSPGQVRSLLARVGIELPDTRAWRLRALAGTHPLVDALLTWRKAERVATTYGYAWLDEHLGVDGRLRGCWTGSDGAAGRMTASAGLHNMPVEMRPAVVAEAGHVFVRADLGQVEPRVLAAVSGDKVLARATLDDDMYAPVAEHLDVDRATAKVAVLGAMYGQTTGDGARALRRLEAAYPVAMAYLAEAYRSGQAGRDLRTYGGRLVPMSSGGPGGSGVSEDRGAAAGRGRYGRNALVQGAAAELFKVWAVTVRARGGRHGAQIVLCLHDELVVHVGVESAVAVAQLLDDCLQEAVRHWAPMARSGSWPTLPLSSAGLMPRPPVWLRAGTATSPRTTQIDSASAGARRPPVTEHSGPYPDDGLPRNKRRSGVGSAAGKLLRLRGIAGSGARRPPDRFEDRDRVEVVPPSGDLAVDNGEHRDVAVCVISPGGDGTTFGGVLKNDHAGFSVVMNGQVETSVEHEGLAIGPVQLSHCGATHDVPRVAGDRDDVLEDDIIGQEVEEVVPVGEPVEALFDNAKERVERCEVVPVTYRPHGAWSPSHAAAVPLAKSVKLVGGAPVTFSTSSLGREPRPEAIVSVSICSIWPYSGGTPDAITLSTQERRSMSTCRTGR